MSFSSFCCFPTKHILHQASSFEFNGTEGSNCNRKECTEPGMGMHKRCSRYRLCNCYCHAEKEAPKQPGKKKRQLPSVVNRAQCGANLGLRDFCTVAWRHAWQISSKPECEGVILVAQKLRRIKNYVELYAAWRAMVDVR